jgi:hypothetical protein
LGLKWLLLLGTNRRLLLFNWGKKKKEGLNYVNVEVSAELSKKIEANAQATTVSRFGQVCGDMFGGFDAACSQIEIKSMYTQATRNFTTGSRNCNPP